MIFLSLLMFTISVVGVSIGFELRKPMSWFFALCGFLGGLTMGLTRNDWSSGIGFGIVAAILVILGGPTNYKYRKYYRGKFFGGERRKKDK